MKYTKQAIALFLILCQTLSFAICKQTPKGAGLANHYGTMPEAGKYGPHISAGFNLRREGVGPNSPVTPIFNYDSQINAAAVVAGDLTNTSYDASQIITAPLAKPKAEIKTTFHHEAIIKTPVHLGTRVEEKQVTTMSRITGKVESNIVHSEKPIVGILNTVRGVETTKTTVIDLTTGNFPAAGPGKILHGTN
jgi:hypothetical protein